MEAYHIDHFGSVDGMILKDSKHPRPGRKEVLMRVRASFSQLTQSAVRGGCRRPSIAINRRPQSHTATRDGRRLI